MLLTLLRDNSENEKWRDVMGAGWLDWAGLGR
jgi:hypothetical protein